MDSNGFFMIFLACYVGYDALEDFHADIERDRCDKDNMNVKHQRGTVRQLHEIVQRILSLGPTNDYPQAGLVRESPKPVLKCMRRNYP